MLRNVTVFVIMSLFSTHGVFATSPYRSPASTDSGGNSGSGASPQSIDTFQGSNGGNSSSPASTDYVIENETYVIGQLAQGGVIYYLDSTNKHGLACSIYNSSSSLTWAPTNVDCGANKNGIGLEGGEYNTQQIVAQSGYNPSNCAAAACVAYAGGGFSDWYLPSLEELYLLLLNYSVVESALISVGGDSLIGDYWSSLEDSINPTGGAWFEGLPTGDQHYTLKSVTNAVRAVRAF